MRFTDKNGQEIELSSLFKALANKASGREIRETFNISRKSLSTLRGAFLAQNPDQLFRFQSQEVRAKIGRRSPQSRPLRFLVDECVSPAITYYVSRYLGWATHIEFQGMSGTKDPDVYQYALEQGFDAIITRDHASNGPNIESKDLTDIALGYAVESRRAEKKGDGYVDDTRFKYPIIIHVNGSAEWNNVIQRIRDYKFDILSAIAKRDSPILVIGKHQFQTGPSYQDIFHDAMKPGQDVIGPKKQKKYTANPRQYYIEAKIKAGENRSGKKYGRTTRRFWEAKLGAYWDRSSGPATPNL